MRILCIGDPHIRRKQLASARVMIDAIIEAARRSSPDKSVVLGDTLHDFRTIDLYAQIYAIEFFEALGTIAPTVVMIGNHERPAHNEYMSSHHAFAVTRIPPGVTIVERTLYEKTPHGWLCYVPFVPKGLYKDAINIESAPPLREVCMLFHHAEMRGCDMYGFKSKKGEEEFGDTPPAIGGHIHDSQRVGSTFYVGTPIQTVYNESEHKGLTMITIDKFRHYVSDFIPLKSCPVIKTITLSARELVAWDIDAQEPDRYERPISWRIVLKDSPEHLAPLPMVKKYEELQSAGVTIVQSPIVTMQTAPVVSRAGYLEGLYARLSPDQQTLLHEILE